MIQHNPPQSDEFELSLFGPGVGECIVVHLGNNKWMVVDSCNNPSTKRPIALDYLDNIGVGPENVDLIVISHWHADHIGGAAKLVDACESARIAISAALLQEEFLCLVSALSGLDETIHIDKKNAATNEMEAIIKTLMHKMENEASYGQDSLVQVTANCLLHENDYCSIRTLSPSNKAYLNALMGFAELLPKSEDLRKITPTPDQNNCAIVLWFTFGNTNILLGSDLVETNDPLTGWSAIINSPLCPGSRATLFKVPHHGSKTGHADEQWTIIDKNPICLLTTNTRSDLPTDKDVRRLKGFSGKVYCTGEPKAKKIKRDPTIEKTMNSIVKSRKILGGNIGQIQVRFRLDSTAEPSVHTKPPAMAL